MQIISDSYKSYFDEHLSLSPKSKITVDGVEYLGNKIKTAPKFSHSNSTFVGGFPAKTVSFEMLDLNNDINFKDKEITVYKGIFINGEVEYIKQGVFIPRAKDIETNISTKTISFKNVMDKTQFLDEAYTSDLDWSIDHSGLEIVQEICNKKNLILENDVFPFSSYMFKQPNIPSNATYREVLSRLAEIGGAICIFNNAGNLEIKSQYVTGDNILRKRYNKLSREKLFSPNLLVIGNKGYDNDIIYPNPKPENAVEYKIEDNPFIDLNREDMIEIVANYVLNLCYIPFEIEDFVDTYNYELNDVIYVTDKNGETFNAVILDISSTSRIKSKLGAPVKEKKLSNYKIAGSNKEAIGEIKFEVNHVKKEIDTLINSTKELEKENNVIKENFDNYVPSSDFVILTNELRQKMTDTYSKLEIDTKLIDGSVTKVNSEGFTFDTTGLNIDRRDENSNYLTDTRGQFNEEGLRVIENGSNENILRAVYDKDLHEGIVETMNLKSNKYIMLENIIRFQKYEDINNQTKVGCFWTDY